VKDVILNSSIINGSAINGYASGFVPTIFTDDFTDYVVLTDALSEVQVVVVRDTAVLSDSIELLPYINSVLDSAVLSDSVAFEATASTDVVDAAVLNDTFEMSLGSNNVLDTAVLNDTVSQTLRAVTLVADTARLGDSAVSGRVDDVLDSAVLNDTFSVMANFVYDAVDAAVLNDSAVLKSEMLVDIRDLVSANDAVYENVIAGNDAVAYAYLNDRLTTQTTQDDCWSSEVSGWAMSRHTGNDITARTDRFAVSPTGLWEVGDTGGASKIVTGEFNFGSSRKKRVDCLWARGMYEGALNVSVSAEVNGRRETYEYTAKPDITDNPTVVRVNFGRGFNSMFYQFTLAPTGQSTLFGCDANAKAMRRRI
jgi:hypothetical protein